MIKKIFSLLPIVVLILGLIIITTDIRADYFKQSWLSMDSVVSASIAAGYYWYLAISVVDIYK
jgi:general stress protein CsbA